MFIALTTGCASVIPVTTVTKTIDKPTLNVTQKEELGNTLLEHFMASTQASLRVMEQWGFNSRIKIYPAQILRPLGVGEKVSLFYVDDTPPDTHDIFRRVCFDPADSVFFIPNSFGICDFIGKAIVNSGPVKVEKSDYIDIKSPQFKQELIYNGKVGNYIKFLYRELSGGNLRAPFTQEIQYDLAEGNIIGFKGARLQIISSSNREIEYIVLSKFNK